MLYIKHYRYKSRCPRNNTSTITGKMARSRKSKYLAAILIRDDRILIQNIPGVDESAEVAYFEMQVGAGRVASAAAEGDHIALVDALSA